VPSLVIVVSAVFGFIVRTDRQTDTESHTDAAERLTRVSNNGN